MYNELVKRLNAYSAEHEKHGGITAEAADAIDALTAYVRQIEELRKDGYYLQKTKMMAYGQAIMTMPLPEPPKEAADGKTAL